MSNSTRVNLKSSIEERVNELIEETVKNEVSQYTHLLTKRVTERIDQLLDNILTKQITQLNFPQASIPHKSIDFTDFSKDFISDIDEMFIPGIEDFSKKVELTLIENGVVVENTLFAKNIEAENIELSDKVLSRLEERFRTIIPEIPDIEHLNQCCREVKEKLSHKDTEISIHELEVTGESILSDVLYTTPGNKRVGINTMEPSAALTVYDQEAEVSFGRFQNNESFIGTTNKQKLNIVANKRVAIGVDPDGCVTIKKLKLFEREISQSNNVPGHAGTRGDIYLNKKVRTGEPVGWVCLEGTKWAPFGTVG